MAVIRTNAWVVLVAGAFMCISSGGIYAFSLYSDALKLALNLHQEEINLVGTLLNAGSWIQLLGGLFCDRFGPRRAGSIGMLLLVSGYFLMFLEGTRVVETGLPFLCLWAFMAGQGGAWVQMTALVTNTHNTPQEHRGRVLGFLFGFYGLSSSIFSIVANGFFASEPLQLLFFIAVASALVVSVCTAVTNDIACPSRNGIAPCTRLSVLSGLMVVLIVTCLTAATLDSVYPESSFACAIVVASLLGLVPFIVVGSEQPIAFVCGDDDTEVSDVLHYHVAPARDEEQGEDEEKQALHVSETHKPNRKESEGGGDPACVSTFQLPCRLDFWLVFFIFSVVLGSGITVINNLHGIAIAVGGNKLDVSLLVSLLSVSNCFGRFLFGFLSDKFSKRLCRTVWLVVLCVSMTLTTVYFAFASFPMLYFGVVWVGLTYGGTCATVATLACEYWGVAHFGGNYGVLGIGTTTGNLCLSTLVAGQLYELHKSPGAVECIGHACYQASFLVNCACCFAGVLCSVALLRHRNSFPRR